MVVTLIRKELLDNIYSFRFIVSFIIVICIMTISTAVLMQDYTVMHDTYVNNLTAHRNRIKDNESYMELMFSGVGANRPPAPLQIFYSGVEKDPNRSTIIYPFFKPQFTGELNINPVFPLFPAIDLLFIVSIVMSLLAFVFSYDAVSGERENGTLKLLMSYAIPRDKIIVAKWIGGYFSLIIPYLLGLLVSALMVLLNPNVKMPGAEWGAFFLTMLASLLFMAVMYTVGIFVSIKSKRSSTSISVLLFIWVIFVLVIPNAVPFIADRIKPIDSPSKVMSRIKYGTGQTIDNMITDTIKNFEVATGISLDQIDFSGMVKDDEEDEEETTTKQESTASSESSSSSTTSGSSSSSDEKSKIPGDFDANQISAVIGEITDNDLREIKLYGCERYLNKQLQAKLGMTIDQAAKMAKDMGYDIDVPDLLAQCESRKSELDSLKKQAEDALESGQAPSATGAPAATAAAPAAQKPKPTVTPEQFWGKFMSLSAEQKGKFYDSMYQSFISANKSTSEVSQKEEEKYQRDVDAQVALAKNLSRISPVSSFIYATTDLASTGIEREKHLKNYLWTYQGQFLEFLTKKFNMPDSERTHNLFGGAFREPPYEIDDFPQFNYKELEIKNRLKYALTDVVVLVIFGFGFFMAAFFAFIKSEIID